MSDDLIKRLRIFAKLDPDHAEAADEIERLREHIAQQQLDIVTLGQEAGRMREALEKIARDSAYGCKMCRDIARAALGEEKKG